jgi:TRAP-type C4-dicarboxylate transport system substrate-binding protein
MLNTRNLFASLAVSAGLGFSPVAAQDVTLRMATAAPLNTIWQQQLDQLAADVAEETEGRVKIEIFYNAQLGAEGAVMPQVMRGRIDMGLFSVASLSDQVAEAYLASLPFFYDDLDERSCILDKVAGDFNTMISSTGMRLLAWSEVGSGQVVGTKPFTTPDTLTGLRIGISANPVANLYWESMGSYPINTPVTEAASNISTGLVDAYNTIPVFYLFAGIAQVAPVLTTLDYVLAPAVLLINDSVWQRLADEDRAGFERALARHPAAERSASFFAFENQIYDMVRGKGGQIVEPTEEERAQWSANIEDYYALVLANSTDTGRAFFDTMLTARDSCSR